jgi:hypothetical protein
MEQRRERDGSFTRFGLGLPCARNRLSDLQRQPAVILQRQRLASLGTSPAKNVNPIAAAALNGFAPSTRLNS